MKKERRERYEAPQLLGVTRLGPPPSILILASGEIEGIDPFEPGGELVED